MGIKGHIIIGFVFILMVTAGIFIFNKIATIRISERIESRYRVIEIANTQLRETVERLTDINRKITKEFDNSQSIVSAVTGIIDDFRRGLSETSTVIERIERGINSFERIIDTMPE